MSPSLERRSVGHQPPARASSGRRVAQDRRMTGIAGEAGEHSEFVAGRSVLLAEWTPVAGRVLLGVVLAWFGYHELVRPGLWSGYVPVVSPTSTLASVAVLVHGWVLLMLAASLIAGVVPGAASAIASVLLVEIVVSLAVTRGLSDLVLRDVGVLGLAVSMMGARHRHLLLR